MKLGPLVSALTVAAIATVTLAWIQDPTPQRLPGPLVAFVGEDSKIAVRRFVRVTDKAQWAALWLEHTGQPQPPADRDFDWFYNPRHVPEVDFAQCMVVAVFQGKCWNSAGVRIVESLAEGDRVLVRFDDKAYQSAGPDGQSGTPFGLFVLPRSTAAIVLEENVQSMIGKPPKWQQRATL
jgi:hypothetical protein